MCFPMRICSICSHTDREAIEATLVAGCSYRSTAGRFQCSKSALVRHRQHGAKQRVSADREALRRQIEALQARAQVARNIVTLGQTVQETVRLLGQLCEREQA